MYWHTDPVTGEQTGRMDVGRCPSCRHPLHEQQCVARVASSQGGTFACTCVDLTRVIDNIGGIVEISFDREEATCARCAGVEQTCRTAIGVWHRAGHTAPAVASGEIEPVGVQPADLTDVERAELVAALDDLNGPVVVQPAPAEEREALEDFEFSADKGPYAATRLPYEAGRDAPKAKWADLFGIDPTFPDESSAGQFARLERDRDRLAGQVAAIRALCDRTEAAGFDAAYVCDIRAVVASSPTTPEARK